tara:strand:- start:656 stop:946 length:291 start_codon:yes stop_codon:yes gene_type:complete
LDDLKTEWWKWHKKNPDFYRLWCYFTFVAIKKGHQNLSGWLIANRVRWETDVETTGNKFKISNNYIALYCRLFMHHYPKYKGFFRIKTMKRAQIND